MNVQRGGSKKRKGESTLEAEKSLYGSFVDAANAVSQLYTAAVQQNKRAEEQGARQALVSAAFSLHFPCLHACLLGCTMQGPAAAATSLPQPCPLPAASPAGTRGPVRGQGVRQRTCRAHRNADGAPAAGAAGATVTKLRGLRFFDWWCFTMLRLHACFAPCTFEPVCTIEGVLIPRAGSARLHNGHSAALPDPVAAWRPGQRQQRCTPQR